MTLQLLYEEYKRDNPDGYERSQFYNLYYRWLKAKDPLMRFNHKTGDKPHYYDHETGKKIEVEFFIFVLGASS